MCVCVCACVYVCACVRACVCVCVCTDQCHVFINGLISLRLLFFFFFLSFFLLRILYVNCISRTVLYMCIEYCVYVSAQGVDERMITEHLSYSS